MMLLILASVVAFVTIYVLWLRSWLKSKSWRWSQAFFSWIEPFEIVLWRKSETILFARFKMFIGLLLTVLTQIGTIDLTPLIPFVPDQYDEMVKLAFNMLPLILTMLGAIDEQLRKDTKTPLDIVALPDKMIAESPKLSAAVAVLDEAKVEAVAVAKEVEVEKAAAVVENAAVDRAGE